MKKLLLLIAAVASFASCVQNIEGEARLPFYAIFVAP